MSANLSQTFRTFSNILAFIGRYLYYERCPLGELPAPQRFRCRGYCVLNGTFCSTFTRCHVFSKLMILLYYLLLSKFSELLSSLDITTNAQLVRSSSKISRQVPLTWTLDIDKDKLLLSTQHTLDAKVVGLTMSLLWIRRTRLQRYLAFSILL